MLRTLWSCLWIWSSKLRKLHFVYFWQTDIPIICLSKKPISRSYDQVIARSKDRKLSSPLPVNWHLNRFCFFPSCFFFLFVLLQSKFIFDSRFVFICITIFFAYFLRHYIAGSRKLFVLFFFFFGGCYFGRHVAKTIMYVQ